MEKQFYECEPCAKSAYGHEYEQGEISGVITWTCKLCGQTRGFCQHEVEVDSHQFYNHETGPGYVDYRYCSHCNQDMTDLTDDYGNLTSTEKADYHDYLECDPLDPRD